MLSDMGRFVSALETTAAGNVATSLFFPASCRSVCSKLPASSTASPAELSGLCPGLSSPCILPSEWGRGRALRFSQERKDTTVQPIGMKDAAPGITYLHGSGSQVERREVESAHRYHPSPC